MIYQHKEDLLRKGASHKKARVSKQKETCLKACFFLFCINAIAVEGFYLETKDKLQ